MNSYKKSLLLLSFVLLLITTGLSQHRLKEKDVLGNWKLIIDIDEELQEAENDLEKEDNVVGKIVLSSISGLVNGILDEVEIYMEFLPKGEAKIWIEAFGEKEIEYTSWRIDDNGKLFIEDTDSYSSDQDFWVMKDGVLVSSEGRNEENHQNVYLVNVD